MIGLSVIPEFTAAGFLIILALMVLARGKLRPQVVLFMFSAMLLAVIETTLGFLLLARTPEGVLGALKILIPALIFFPVVGLPFFMTFGRENDRELISQNLAAIIILCVLLGIAAFIVPPHTVAEEIHFTEEKSFQGMTFTGFGKGIGIYLLLVNVFFLYCFENTYRAAGAREKITLKYPLLGILVASLINFIVMSRLIAVSFIDINFLAIHSCGIMMVCASFLLATTRHMLFDVKAYSNRDEHFHPDAYNYRKEWRKYARLMASAATIDELASNLISAVCGAIPVQKGLAWIDFRGGISAYYGVVQDEIDESLPGDIMRLPSTEPVIIAKHPPLVLPMDPAGGHAGKRKANDWIHAVALLGTAGENRGFLALGPKDTKTPYTYEDREFIATIADHALPAIKNLVMEERLIESNQIESFNRFASFVVHDLKNTVGMLSLAAKSAVDNIRDAEIQRDTIATIKRSVEKMQRLIYSLNTHKSPTSIRRMHVDVSSLIERSIQSVGSAAALKKVSVEFTGERGIMGTVDPTAIQRVIENLLLNAIEATPPDGRIEIATCTVETGGLEITVRDNGAGFDPEYLRIDLFKPFRSTKNGGLGIGLMLCRSLVEAHGGSLTIDSEPGHGAAVTVSLPAGSDSGRCRRCTGTAG